MVVDIAIPSNCIIHKKEHEKVEKHQGVKGELKRAWKLKVSVVPMVIETLGGSNPQTGGVSRTNPRKNIRLLSPKKRSLRNSKVTAQNPEAPTEGVD